MFLSFYSHFKAAREELTYSIKCKKRFVSRSTKIFLYGRTYFVVLFSSVNVGCGPAEERVLLTGLHAVSDIYCECCKTTLGWKYVSIVKEIIYRLLNCKKNACEGNYTRLLPTDDHCVLTSQNLFMIICVDEPPPPLKNSIVFTGACIWE